MWWSISYVVEYELCGVTTLPYLRIQMSHSGHFFGPITALPHLSTHDSST